MFLFRPETKKKDLKRREIIWVIKTQTFTKFKNVNINHSLSCTAMLTRKHAQCVPTGCLA